MIKNERQYKMTKAAIALFEENLRKIDASDVPPNSIVHPTIQRAEREAIKSQLDDLVSQLREYEELSSGKVSVLELDSLEDLPRGLVTGRIASGMSQRELADKLGLKEQQIQRYEASDYQQASLSRLLAIAKAVNVRIRNEIFLPNSDLSETAAFKRLEAFGLSKDFVFRRLASRAAVLGLLQNSPDALDRVVFSSLRAVSRVFGWTPAAILGRDTPWLAQGALGTVRFKVNASADEKYLSIYACYAHFLATLLLRATEDIPVSKIPIDPKVAHASIMDRYGTLSFSSVLEYSWDLGVPVLPLDDPGAFHGACWRADGRNVIVLKQRTTSLARWLFDLLHEIRHAAENPTSLTFQVLEESDSAPARASSPEEQEASWYAGEVTLHGQAEVLALRCQDRAKGRIEALKKVVPAVAIEANVDPATLANYMAFRLSLQGENWWGAATNLQPQNQDPWLLARDVLLRRANFSRLSGLDRDLLIQALQHEEP